MKSGGKRPGNRAADPAPGELGRFLGRFPETTRKKLLFASLSASTRRAYGGALKAFDEATAGHEITDGLVANYLSGKFAAGRSPSTCAVIVAALRFRAELQRTLAPIGRHTERVLAGIRREGRDRGRGQVDGVGFGQAMSAAAQAAASGGLAGLRDAALIDTMSDGLLRPGEAAALRIEDLTFHPDGSGDLLIRSSKTDSEGRGAVEYLGAPTVARLRAWLEAAGLEDGPLFPRLHRGGSLGESGLSTNTVRRILKRRCAEAGIEGNISGHSLRVGGAQSLAAGGADLVELQTAGRWTSPQMPAHYARGQLAAGGAMARLKYGWTEPEATPPNLLRKKPKRGPP